MYKVSQCVQSCRHGANSIAFYALLPRNLDANRERYNFDSPTLKSHAIARLLQAQAVGVQYQVLVLQVVFARYQMTAMIIYQFQSFQ